jgi:hypothetical protein
VASLTVSLFVTLSFFSELLQGELGLIDDHEYINALGSDRKIDPSEVPGLIAQSEAGAWGESLRFRPGYFALKVVQTMFFAGNGESWYAFRLVLFAITLLLLGWSAWIWLGRILEDSYLPRIGRLIMRLGVLVLFIYLMASLRAWTDIVPRLGPSELVLGFGFSLLVFGLTLIWVREDLLLGHWAANLGLIVAVTNKENGIFLLLPLYLIVGLQLKRSRWFSLKLFLLFCSGAVSFWVASGVLVAMQKAGGVDVYGLDRTLGGLFTALQANSQMFSLVLVILVVLALESYLNRSSVSTQTTFLRKVRLFVRDSPFSLAGVLSLLVFVAEMFFYQHSTSSGNFQPPRYGLMSEFATSLIYFFALMLAIRLLVSQGKGVWVLVRRAVGAVVSVLVLSGTLPTVFSAVSQYPVIAKEAVSAQAYNMTRIMEGSKYLREEPDSQVLIFVDEPYDYERLFALPLFLEYYADRSVDFYAQVQIPVELQPDEYFVGLSDTLEDIGQNGGWEISPLNEQEESSPTLCIYFGQVVSSPNCAKTIGIG